MLHAAQVKLGLSQVMNTMEALTLFEFWESQDN